MWQAIGRYEYAIMAVILLGLLGAELISLRRSNRRAKRPDRE